MKKFVSAAMFLLLVCLTCILVYAALNLSGLDLHWNNTQISSAIPKEIPVSSPPRSQGTAVQEVVPDDDDDRNRLPVSQSIAPASKNYQFLRQHSSLDCLTDSGSRALYNQMLQTAYTVMVKPDKDGYYPINSITVKKQKITEKQIRMAVLAFRNDNPQIFWIANRYSYSNSGRDTIVKMYSYIPANQCNVLIKKLNAAISKIISAVPAGLSELDREIYIYRMIAQKCSYDDAAVSNTKLWLPHTAAGAIVDGKAVCEGYSRAMQILSSYCGLDCQLVNGEGNGAAHMWNLIQIDDNWYHFDTTWSDNTVPNYDYFNVTDSVIRADHIISADISTLTEEQVKTDDTKPADYNLTLPSCNAVEANYFRAKGIHIKNFGSENNSAVISAIVAAAKVRSSSIVLYIENNLDYKQTVRKMVKALPYQLSYYINMANKTLGGSITIDTNNIGYTEAENIRGFTVFLSYK